MMPSGRSCRGTLTTWRSATPSSSTHRADADDMKTLGISGKYRDAAAALAVDGRVIAAATEDSFARIAGVGYQTTGGAPLRAIGACLQAAGIDADDIDDVVIVAEDGDQGAPASRSEASLDMPEVLGA